MTENVIIALISKLPANWIITLLIGWFLFRQAKMAWSCLYKLFQDRAAKELLKEQRYYSLLNDYNRAIGNNTQALNEFREVLKDFNVKIRKKKK